LDKKKNAEQEMSDGKGGERASAALRIGNGGQAARAVSSADDERSADTDDRPRSLRRRAVQRRVWEQICRPGVDQ
jgi:hypothetical protein